MVVEHARWDDAGCASVAGGLEAHADQGGLFYLMAHCQDGDAGHCGRVTNRELVVRQSTRARTEKCHASLK
jgi:hypothetical protein